jgi:6,7-dimethyl-8-ribityllumazine synthase
MVRVFDGKQGNIPRREIGIAVSRYHHTITGAMLDGAIASLRQAGVFEDSILIAYAPGAWELPIVAQRLVQLDRTAAVIALGAVIRGETSHDQHINRAVSLALMELGQSSGKPVALGLLTCDSVEQAIQRSGGTHGNKGSECAEAVLELLRLFEQLHHRNVAH